jgi:signal transduction histidine kinase
VFAVLLVAGSVLLVSTLQSRLTDASDELSRSRLDDLLTLARSGDLPPTLRNVADNGAAQVVTVQGEVLASSPNMAGDPPVADLRPGRRAQTTTLRALDDHEPETYRFWYAAGPSPQGRVVVYVGDSLETVTEASAALRHALWLGVPVVVLVLGAVMWVLLGQTLGRLDRIRAEVDRISEQNLDTRVPGEGVDDEVGRLAATMNAMLGRLDAAAQRQRDFVADVSHDLQTPLATQRVALELALSRPADIDVDRLRHEVLGATDDMERLVGDLLVLAAVDARAPAAPAAIDLDDLVLEEAARARTTATVQVETAQVSAAPAYADPADVRRIVRNLLGNAVSHAHSRVDLVVDSCEVDGERWAELCVVDDGPGIPVEHRERVFERFHRGDDARSHDGGSGLGLPIARGLTERNGGRLDLVQADAGVTMQLRLRSRPEPTDSAEERCEPRSHGR